MKIVKEVHKAKSTGSRYFLFRKVLSTTQIENALGKVPRTSSLYTLEEGRRWAQDGNLALQKYLRSLFIHFRKNDEEEEEEDEVEERQMMCLPDFYLLIARKIGLENANLCTLDKFIEHDKSLSVSS